MEITQTMIEGTKKYKYSLLLGIILLSSLTISFFYLQCFITLISTIVVLLFSVPISLFWLKYDDPVLRITKIEPDSLKSFLTASSDVAINENVRIRIVIENKGRSAAKECKGYIITSDSRKRTCWMIHDRLNATINVNDSEHLDLFSYTVGGSLISFPSENGWDNVREIHRTEFPNDFRILITSENAEPVNTNFKIIDFDQKKFEIGKK